MSRITLKAMQVHRTYKLKFAFIVIFTLIRNKQYPLTFCLDTKMQKQISRKQTKDKVFSEFCQKREIQFEVNSQAAGNLKGHRRPSMKDFSGHCD